MNVTLPIGLFGPTTVQGGYFGDAVTGTTYTDTDASGNVTLATVGANTFYRALVNGISSQGLGTFSVSAPVSGSLPQQSWGTPIPSAPFGPANTNIRITLAVQPDRRRHGRDQGLLPGRARRPSRRPRAHRPRPRGSRGGPPPRLALRSEPYPTPDFASLFAVMGRDFLSFATKKIPARANRSGRILPTGDFRIAPGTRSIERVDLRVSGFETVFIGLEGDDDSDELARGADTPRCSSGGADRGCPGVRRACGHGRHHLGWRWLRLRQHAGDCAQSGRHLQPVRRRRRRRSWRGLRLRLVDHGQPKTRRSPARSR